jgi:ubiquinone/menaquinone biosynthesis C-methylase UbiE
MARTNEGPGIADAFDRSHSGRMRSATVERIYRAAFGDDYPQDAQPNAFYSRTTLRRLASALEVGPDRMVVDLGCGHGRPGLWVAQQTGASLVGIDLSPVGIELAGRRAAELGLSQQVRFQVGDVTKTGLPDASCDAAMSLDVLPFVPDKAAAVAEVARILRSGGRFAFTTWEQVGRSAAADSERAALSATFQAHPLVESARADYRSLLEDAGFAVETYEEPPGWRGQQRALAEGIIAAEEEVTREMGAHYPAMARVFVADLPAVRYVFVAARRPASR